jgi:hypothetical protein
MDDRNLSATSSVNITGSGLLDLTNLGTAQVTAGLTGSGQVQLGPNSLTVNVDTPQLFSGQILGDDAALEKGGSDTLTLTGALDPGDGLVVHSGTVTLTNTTATAQLTQVSVGDGTGTPAFNVANGATVAVSGSVGIDGSGAGATVDVSGGGASLTAGGTIDVGNVGKGTLTVGAGGIVQADGEARVYDNGSAINLNGGTLIAGGLFTDGDPGLFNWTSGTLELTGGDFDIGLDGPLGESLDVDAGKVFKHSGGEMRVGVGAGSNSTLEISGGGRMEVADAMTVGRADSDDSTSVTIENNSSLAVGGVLTIARDNSSTLTVQGGGLLTAGEVQLGTLARRRSAR